MNRALLLALGIALGDGLSGGLCRAQSATPPMAAQTAPVAIPGDTAPARLIIEKSARRLSLYRYGTRVGSFHIALGEHPQGPKWTEQDGRTPEGDYTVDLRVADSAYHRGLRLSYPSAQDLARIHAQGLDRPGGWIEIHGEGDDGRPRTGDWTDGCIALSNADIDLLWARVPLGTPVRILP